MPEAASLLREVSRIELELVNGTSADAGTVDTLLERVRGSDDGALVGRVLCLASRSQCAQGRHDLALSTAEAGLRAVDRLHGAQLRRYSGLRAELLRTAGSALATLGRIAEALPMLENAVRVAESGLDASAESGLDAAVVTEPHVTKVSAQNSLVRSLTSLGIALFSIGAIDAAIDVYGRALQVTDGDPDMAEHFMVDAAVLRSNLTEALHERVERRRVAGDAELAVQDIDAARRLLDAQARLIDAASTGSANAARAPAALGLSPYARASYYAAWGEHLLITAKPAEALVFFERELGEIRSLDNLHHWGVGHAQTSIARALLELNDPREALAHGALALRALEHHDDAKYRTILLSVIAGAHRALGDYRAAYDALAQHHALRARLEAVVAQQYASHMTAQLGLERARADTQALRRIATMLETLGQIGQEITANLDAAAVFKIFTRHVGTLLDATAFMVWLLDPAHERLVLGFGLEDGQTITAGDITLGDPHSLAARAVRERCEIFRRAATSTPETTWVACGTRLMQTALFEPLTVGDRVLGVVSIQSDKPDAYGDNDRLIFRTLSTYAAIALDNAGAYAKLGFTVEALRAAQSELAEQNIELERLSKTDMLTGVANRRHLHERALVAIATMRREAGQLAVAMFDIDHFKSVNDRYGHAAGDAVLVRIAQVAREGLRPADMIARLGGEEFALLLPEVGLQEAVMIAERIRASIAATVVLAGSTDVRVTSSFGVAAFEAGFDTLDRALSRADHALYAAKLAGRDRVYAANRSSPYVAG